MSGFEYVSVLGAIVVGLALTDVLVSLHKLLRAPGLVRWDWAAPTATVFAVLTIIQIWWGLFAAQDQPLTIGLFLPELIELVLLFLLAACALPDDVPAGGLDLRLYYDRNGPYFWTLYAAALAWPTLTTVGSGLLAGHGLAVVTDRWVDFVILGVFISLIFIRNRWWHLAAFALMSLGPIGWMSKAIAA
ncbi:MAG: hypothetical protein JWR84_3366 [Caulobacter sp.]|nr:hypothetical protein [Caulobacter sp.]